MQKAIQFLPTWCAEKKKLGACRDGADVGMPKNSRALLCLRCIYAKHIWTLVLRQDDELLLSLTAVLVPWTIAHEAAWLRLLTTKPHGNKGCGMLFSPRMFLISAEGCMGIPHPNTAEYILLYQHPNLQ